MKIIATADLHYEWHEEARVRVRALAREVSASGADALAIAGDTFAFDPAILDECLGLFRDFAGLKMLVAGNHDLWVRTGSSWPIFEQVIPAVARRHGFVYLEQDPAVLGPVGFVGTIGWYDYSFRPLELNVPDRFYEAKTGPGYALAKPEWRHLVEPPYPPPTPEQLRIGAQWMDVHYVRLGISDQEFTRRLAVGLTERIAQVRDRVEDLVVVMHHLAFREAVKTKSSPAWQFGNAFMGAQVFGETLAAEPTVRLLFYGHSHTEGIVRHGRVVGVNVGSTYRRKRYVVVDTEDWSVEHREAET